MTARHVCKHTAPGNTLSHTETRAAEVDQCDSRHRRNARYTHTHTTVHFYTTVKFPRGFHCTDLDISAVQYRVSGLQSLTRRHVSVGLNKTCEDVTEARQNPVKWITLDLWAGKLLRIQIQMKLSTRFFEFIWIHRDLTEDTRADLMIKK